MKGFETKENRLSSQKGFSAEEYFIKSRREVALGNYHDGFIIALCALKIYGDSASKIKEFVIRLIREHVKDIWVYVPCNKLIEFINNYMAVGGFYKSGFYKLDIAYDENKSFNWLLDIAIGAGFEKIKKDVIVNSDNFGIIIGNSVARHSYIVTQTNDGLSIRHRRSLLYPQIECVRMLKAIALALVDDAICQSKSQD